jgi:hypothetical protein
VTIMTEEQWNRDCEEQKHARNVTRVDDMNAECLGFSDSPKTSRRRRP